MKTRSRRLLVLFLTSVIVLFLYVASSAFWDHRAFDFRSGGHARIFAIQFHVYAEDHDGQFPPLSSIPGRLMCDKDRLHPTYIEDLFVMISPADPIIRTIQSTEPNADFCYDHCSYMYLGYRIWDDETVKAFANAYRDRISTGLPFDDTLHDPDSGLQIPRLTKADSTPDAGSPPPSEIPVLIERPRPYPGKSGLFLFGALPLSEPIDGGVVVYLDGHAEFIEFPGKWPMTEKTISTLQQLADNTALADVPPAIQQTLAFPGAEGYGRYAKGGRGGDVYHVINLADDGPGSLRDGVMSASGPRTIVFDISGTIELKSKLLIENKGLTIAGQTAPGDGITIKDHEIHLRNASDVIIRYIRVRLGDQNKVDRAPDCITADYCDGLIIDHVSASWSIDGIHDTRGCKNYTMQWCILSEALNHSIHPDGAHAMCASFRAPLSNVTIHHNIFATSRDRHPTIGGSVQDPQWIMDFRNNVIYNWSGAANVCDNQVNLINNYFRPGPETTWSRGPVAMKASLPDKAHGHMSGNVFESRDEFTANNYASLDFVTWLKPDSGYKYAGTLENWKVDKAYDLGEATPITQTAEDAYNLVLSNAGASHKRDAVDVRVLDDIKNHRGKLIDSQEEVGGWPPLKSEPAPTDTDQDGMPDTWETEHNLNPNDPDDGRADANDDGYTNLEDYLNDIAPAPYEIRE